MTDKEITTDMTVTYSVELTSKPLSKPGDRVTFNGIPATVIEVRPCSDCGPDVCPDCRPAAVLWPSTYLAAEGEGAPHA